MTLDELFVKFEMARLEFLAINRETYLSQSIQARQPWWWVEQYTKWLTSPNGLYSSHADASEVRKAAKLYMIAKDKGMAAAMLWKLSQS